jgi:hypothetical protein
MRSSKAAALAPLTGVLAALLYAAGILLFSDTPDSNASGAKVLAYYVEHESDQQAAAVIFAYGSLFLVLFGAALRSGLRRGDRGADGPATLAFGGAILMATGIMLLTGLSLAIADKPSALDPAAAQAINALGNSLWIPFIVGQSVLMLGAGAAILRGGALPSWLGWVAFVLGVVSATPVGWFAFFLVLLWIIVVAIMLARRASRPDGETGGEVPAAG